MAWIKLQTSMCICLAIQAYFRASDLQIWTSSNHFMGLCAPMHHCITICQNWKVNVSVQLSTISPINRASITQKLTHIGASFDPPFQTLNSQRISLKNSLEFELESPLFWNSILQESIASKPFHSLPASKWSESKHKQDQDPSNSDLH